MNNILNFESISESKKLFNQFLNGISNIVTNGEYANFLRFSKNFKYSFNNIVLIYTQRPNATKVAGEGTWRTLGRTVKKEEKDNPIEIMQPLQIEYCRKRKKKNTEIEIEDEEKEEIEYTSYKSTKLYDISQTEGDKVILKEEKQVYDNSDYMLELLKSYSPYRIIETNIFSWDSLWKPNEKTMYIAENYSDSAKAITIIQYLIQATYIKGDYNLNRDLYDTFIESVTFAVADYFNLDTSNFAFKNISYWVKGNTNVIIKLGEKIKKTAKDFIEDLEGYSISMNKVA